MARSMERRSSSLAVMAVLAAIPLVMLGLSGAAFVPVPRVTQQQPGPAAAVGAMSAAATLAGIPQSALAEEEGGFLNLGKIELGGGFAINLDIPETGIFNIVILIAGLIYLLGPVLSESMATREKEIQEDIDDAVAKYNEAATRLAEAKKAESQAAEVIAEIQASIAKDQQALKEQIEKSYTRKVEQEEASAEREIKNMESIYERKLASFIDQEAGKIGARRLKMGLSDAEKGKVLEFCIEEFAAGMKKEGEKLKAQKAKYEA